MKKYYLYIIIAASLWGTIGIIVKSFYAAGFSPIQLVCFRTFIGGLLIFIYLIANNKSKLKIKLKDKNAGTLPCFFWLPPCFRSSSKC
ncbi:MAG: EamA family transporter [Peptostreptococcaceae bacterium]|nr:EamA family transporter [Peptostreptococcaceae bacterium]